MNYEIWNNISLKKIYQIILLFNDYKILFKKDLKNITKHLKFRSNNRFDSNTEKQKFHSRWKFKVTRKPVPRKKIGSGAAPLT